MYNNSQRFGMRNIEITWNFFGSRHGKYEADGEAVVVKNHLDCVVKAENILMKTAADVFSTLNRSDRNIPSGKSWRHFYLVSAEELAQARKKAPPSECVPRFPAVRSVHQVYFASQNRVTYSLLSCYCTDDCDHELATSQYSYPGV